MRERGPGGDEDPQVTALARSRQFAWLPDPINGDGTKVVLSILGSAFGDARQLGIAHAFERATKHRRAPTYPETVARI